MQWSSLWKHKICKGVHVTINYLRNSNVTWFPVEMSWFFKSSILNWFSIQLKEFRFQYYDILYHITLHIPKITIILNCDCSDNMCVLCWFSPLIKVNDCISLWGWLFGCVDAVTPVKVLIIVRSFSCDF